MNKVILHIGRILLLTALLGAIYLTWTTIQEAHIPGCGKGSSCDAILSSRWSKFLTIPVAALGAVLYALTLALSFRPARKKILLTASTTLTILAALWFLIVQAFIIHKFCPWCCTIHALATIGAIIIWLRIKSPSSNSKAQSITALLAISSITAMAFWQSNSSEPNEIKTAALPKNSISADAHKLYLYGSSVIVDQDRLPFIGSSTDAPIAILVSDYTCPYCLELYRKLKQLEKEDPQILRTIILPGFHDNDSKQIHRLMLALWRTNPELYGQITDLLINGTIPRESKAIHHIIKKNHPADFSLDLQVYGRWAAQMLVAGNDLMLLNSDALGTRNLPQLMIGDTILTGNPSIETLREKAEASGTVKQSNKPWTHEKIKPGKGWEEPLAQGFKYDFEILDMGRPGRGKSCHAVFKFLNTGNDPVTINKLSLSCGCASAEILTKTIPPGETGSFQVNIDTRSIEGRFKNTTTVWHSRSSKPHKVRVLADVWSPLAAYPNGLEFGNTLITNPPSSIFSKLIALEGKPIKITSVTSDDPHFTPTLKTLTEGRQYQLNVKTNYLKPKNHTNRRITSTINIHIDHPKHPIFRLPVSITYVDAVQISPALLKLNPPTTKTPYTLIVRCHDKKFPNLKINKLTLVTSAETIELETEKTTKSNRTYLNFNLPPNSEQPQHLIIETNHPKAAQLKVPIDVTFKDTKIPNPEHKRKIIFPPKSLILNHPRNIPIKNSNSESTSSSFPTDSRTSFIKASL